MFSPESCCALLSAVDTVLSRSGQVMISHCTMTYSVIGSASTYFAILERLSILLLQQCIQVQGQCAAPNAVPLTYFHCTGITH